MTKKETEIKLKPIGIIKSDFLTTEQVPIKGGRAIVEVFPEYSKGLMRIEENSHLWLQMWFHEANRDLLSTVPGKVNSNLPEYGVFSIRAIGRPNPIALSLVQLDKVEGNKIYVNGLDAIDGTHVLDIKPYYEQEIVFSPVTPYIRPLKREMRQQIFIKQALYQHQEKCNGFRLGVRMALIADEYFGQLNSNDLNLKVIGSRCLADILQGLSNARLANPCRFSFVEDFELEQSIWEKDGKRLIITAKKQINDEEFIKTEDKQIFEINYK